MWYVGLVLLLNVLSHALQVATAAHGVAIHHYCEDDRGKATSSGKTLFIFTHWVGEVWFKAHEEACNGLAGGYNATLDCMGLPYKLI